MSPRPPPHYRRRTRWVFALPVVMGCIASSPEDGDEAGSSAKPNAGSRRSLARTSLAEASTKVLGTGCEQGHPFVKYDVLDTLGTGGFAVVKRVRLKTSGKNFAMKIINVTLDKDPVRVYPGSEGRRPIVAQLPKNRGNNLEDFCVLFLRFSRAPYATHPSHQVFSLTARSVHDSGTLLTRIHHVPP